MAGKTIVEQLLAMLVSLFSFTGNDKVNGFVMGTMKCMVAFIIIMYVLSIFLNAVGLADDMVGDIAGWVVDLFTKGIGSGDGG